MYCFNIDIQSDLPALKEELPNIIVQIEESRRQYIPQYDQLIHKIELDLSSKQQTQPQIIATNRPTFQPNLSASSQSSLSQSQPLQPPLRAFSSQPQKNNPNRRTENRSHKRSNVTHSDRARAAASNSNNVWSRVEQFFLPVPSDQEIEKIFNCHRVPTIKEIKGDIVHWSTKISPPSCRANGKAIMPPGPPSSSNDTAKFWTKNKAFFQIEKIQKLNSSPLHCLLNAFVEVKPEEFEQAKKLITETRQKNEYARIHSLLPNIDHEGYLEYPFEVRLNLELESLELNQPRKSSMDDKPFQKEINDLRNNIANKYIPEFDKLHDEIVQNIPEYRKNQQLRNEKTELIDQKINEFSVRKRKRKD